MDTPEVFEPLWASHARYKGAWGGRGSAKSNDRAQAVISAMISEPGVRIACVREVQKSIKDSSRQLLVDWIQRYEIGSMFDVIETEIRGPGESLCIFRGMSDQNAESIKSLGPRRLRSVRGSVRGVTADYRCMGCSVESSGPPGSTTCAACGSIYVECATGGVQGAVEADVAVSGVRAPGTRDRAPPVGCPTIRDAVGDRV